uniref:Spondin 2b, extracellular matrix protein n=1 Tax=Hucho hucho TaxID=62062 RepID=A0A4W5PWK7_9TELE
STSSVVHWLASLTLTMSVTIDPVYTVDANAKYSLTFSGKWSQNAFPKQYPIYRPPAQWSPLIVETIISGSENEFARNRVREFSEKGEAWRRRRRLRKTSRVCCSPLQCKLSKHPHNPYYSFLSPQLSVVRIVPSPDWFLGVDSFNLREGDHWKESITLELYPYDAGTDSGFTFSSPNFETIPQDKITSFSPSHHANSFYYHCLKNLPPMGKVTLTKINSNQIFSIPMEPTQFNQTGNEIEDSLISNQDTLDIFQSYPSDRKRKTIINLMSVWSPWGLCKGKCGDSGVCNRTRYIHLQPANNGVVCRPLEEEKKCISNNCL